MPAAWTTRGPPFSPSAGRTVLAPALGRSRAFGMLFVPLSQVTEPLSPDSTPCDGTRPSYRLPHVLQCITEPQNLSSFS